MASGHLDSQVKNLVDRGFEVCESVGASVNGLGEPIPWFSYPAIDFISNLDLSKKFIFEFGCGNSTLFFQLRCAKLRSVEHNGDWYNRIKELVTPNVELTCETTVEGYLAAVEEDVWDVIIIDGAQNFCPRKTTAERAIGNLNPSGIVIVDNSDCHIKVPEFLRNQGLIQADFNGICPLNEKEVTTSIFFTRQYSNWVPPGKPLPQKTPWNMQHTIDE